MFNLSHHEPNEVTHQTVLQCVVFQLDVALEQIETQRNGLVFIYNMTNSKYSNFDYDLSQKMLTLLKGVFEDIVLDKSLHIFLIKVAIQPD